MAEATETACEKVGDSPRAVTVGAFVVAVSGVILVFSEVFATLGAMAAAFLDVRNFGATTWIVLLTLFAPPTIWLFVRFLKIAIESELRTDEEVV